MASSFSIFTCCGVVFLSALLTDITKSEKGFERVYSWKEVDFQFPADQDREALIQEKKFVIKNNVIAGIKVFGDNIYLSVPRWRSGVPVTLARLPLKTLGAEGGNGPPLKAFPGWDMNRLGDCSALQYVQSMEIDQFGRMWVVDVGRVNILEEEADNKCPPKLVLLQTGSSEEAEVLLSYEFPPEVVSRNSSFLNDIAVGCVTEEDCWAFISDAGDAKIVFYNLEQNKSWFAKHSSMLIDPPAANITIQGKGYAFKTGVNGIALSPRDSAFGRLYYSPLSSFKLYSVETSALRKLSELDGVVGGGSLEDSDVTEHGSKKSQSGGMIMDAEGRLYYGLLNDNSVYFWNTTESKLSTSNQMLVIKDDSVLQWPDTFAIGGDGHGYVTTNKLHQFTTNSYDFEETNFHVVRFQVGVKSYMYSAPSLSGDASSEDEGTTTGSTVDSVTEGQTTFLDEVVTESGTERDGEEMTTGGGKVGRCEDCGEVKPINYREGKKYTDPSAEKQKNKTTTKAPHEHDHSQHDHDHEHYDHDQSQAGHDHSEHTTDHTHAGHDQSGHAHNHTQTGHAHGNHTHDHGSHNHNHDVVKVGKNSALNTQNKDTRSDKNRSSASFTSHFLLAISSVLCVGMARLV